MLDSNMHRQLAVECFNSCWKLIDKETRTDEEDEEMRRLSEVSLFHWQHVENCTDQNRSIGYWQLARVYAITDKLDIAMDYAEKCQHYSQDLGPFCRAYSFEATARVLSLDGQLEQAREYVIQASDLKEQVEDEKDRELLSNDLDSIML